MEPFKDTVVELLLSYLDLQAKTHLADKNIKPEMYILFQYEHALKRTERAGFAVTASLSILLFILGFIAGQETAVEHAISGAWFPWFSGACTGALGLIIGWLSLRALKGKQSKHIETPDDTTGMFIQLSTLDSLKTSYIKELSDAELDAIRAFSPNLNSKRYQIPETTNQKPSSLTQKQEHFIVTLKRLKWGSGWLVLPGIIFVLDDSMFFIFWAWMFAGLWLLFASIIDLVRRRLEVLGDGGDTLVFHGRLAQTLTIFLIIVTVLVFILPGLVGIIAIMGGADLTL